MSHIAVLPRAAAPRRSRLAVFFAEAFAATPLGILLAALGQR